VSIFLGEYQIQPPLLMSTDYGPPPPGLRTSTFNKFWGVPPEPSDSADTLMGNAGSSGKVRGPAKIDGDAGRVRIIE
jgi:hypothetical protein